MSRRIVEYPWLVRGGAVFVDTDSAWTKKQGWDIGSVYRVTDLVEQPEFYSIVCKVDRDYDLAKSLIGEKCRAKQKTACFEADTLALVVWKQAIAADKASAKGRWDQSPISRRFDAYIYEWSINTESKTTGPYLARGLVSSLDEFLS